MIKGLNSVIIWTDDVARLVPFYRDVLGLDAELFGDEFAAFLAGGPQVVLGKHSHVRGRSKDPNRVMVNLTVDDCRAEYERLRAKGVEFVREPEEDQGLIIATFTDPDGNTLQLFQQV